jgi:hypothetical protein
MFGKKKQAPAMPLRTYAVKLKDQKQPEYVTADDCRYACSFKTEAGGLPADVTFTIRGQSVARFPLDSVINVTSIKYAAQ